MARRTGPIPLEALGAPPKHQPSSDAFHAFMVPRQHSSPDTYRARVDDAATPPSYHGGFHASITAGAAGSSGHHGGDEITFGGSVERTGGGGGDDGRRTVLHSGSLDWAAVERLTSPALMRLGAIEVSLATRRLSMLSPHGVASHAPS
mmetsp:Transcript_34740/g.87120  ORF Transcript_34740/g.87120 Transcript_34740/m.87120 type:complete len:148 (-) Transcript_34740:183-626(-)